jgi:CheY-like chemotaxis protein
MVISRESIVDILLVEDNPSDAELALHSLKKNNLANNLVWVKDGEAALDFLFHRGEYAGRPNQLPKVVLLDLRLPKIDGIEVLRQIRGDAKTKKIPVVILTSSKEEQDVTNSYDLGINSYVAKPVAFEDFAKVVANLGMYWVLVNHAPAEIRQDI